MGDPVSGGCSRNQEGSSGENKEGSPPIRCWELLESVWIPEILSSWGSRSPKRALGRGLRTAAAAEERQEPCADCAGAEGEHDAVGPSLESVPNALGGGERHKHRAGSIPEIQSSGLSGLL